MINIIGVDIGRNGFVAVALVQFVSNPQQWFNQNRNKFIAGAFDVVGLSKLESLNPQGLVAEPTGGWYSAFLKAWASSKNIPIYWVGHADLAAQRKSYGFQNKRDDEDALSLALTYFDERFINRQGQKRFLKFEVGAAQRLRELFLELEQIDKIKTSLVNQLRQRLCKEFPEASQRESKISPKLGFAPLWGYLAGLHSYTSIKALHNGSVAKDLGIELSDFTRDHARAICELEGRQLKVEMEVATCLEFAEFQPYLQVFRRFGFGLRNQVLLLSQIYPFEKFLLDGQPWVEWEQPLQRRSKSKGPLPRPQKRYRSLRSFQGYLGLSYTLKQSGDSLSKKFLGSDLVRSHLYMWCVDRLRRPEKNTDISNFILRKDPRVGHIHAFSEAEEFTRLPVFKLTGRVGYSLNRKVIQMEYDGVKGSDKVLRIVFRATALLFQELCKELL